MPNVRAPKLSALAGKTVLLRLDLNVPLRNGRIRDDHKLKAALPVIKLLRRRSPLIIMTHIGEPQPKKSYQEFAELSVSPIARYLKKKLSGRIVIAKGTWKALREQATAMKPGDIMLLENLRFWKGEVKNDNTFARQLASLAQVYVNDAFAVSHRQHASVSAIKKMLPSFAGPLLAQELRQLDRVSDGRRPSVLVLGGAKISSKLPLIDKFLTKADTILVGGGLANTLLRERGIEIGNSYADALAATVARRLRSSKIVLPIDAVVKRGRSHRIVAIDAVAKKDIIIDIGPATASLFARHIGKARTIFWNGPVGIFEDAAARNGTKALFKALSRATAAGALTVVGGGETADAAQEFGYTKKLTWISTGGGASLSYLSGERMPGLTGLRN